MELHVIDIYKSSITMYEKHQLLRQRIQYWGVCYNMEVHQRVPAKDNLFKTFRSFIFA